MIKTSTFLSVFKYLKEAGQLEPTTVKLIHRIQEPGGLYSTEPAPFMASRPSSAVIRTVVWIFEMAPPAAAAISANADLTLSGPSKIKQRSNSPN